MRKVEIYICKYAIKEWLHGGPCNPLVRSAKLAGYEVVEGATPTESAEFFFSEMRRTRFVISQKQQYAPTEDQLYALVMLSPIEVWVED